MKSPIALIAIMAGLAIAHPLAGSTDIRGYSDTANTIQEVRNKLMRCLERRVSYSLCCKIPKGVGANMPGMSKKPVGTKPNWSIVIASQYTVSMPLR